MRKTLWKPATHTIDRGRATPHAVSFGAGAVLFLSGLVLMSMRGRSRTQNNRIVRDRIVREPDTLVSAGAPRASTIVEETDQVVYDAEKEKRPVREGTVARDPTVGRDPNVRVLTRGIDRRIERRTTWTKAGPVDSELVEDDLILLETEAAATVATPSVLGLWGFATATWIFATTLTGAVPFPFAGAALPILVSFGGVALFIAGLYAFRRADALLATAFTIYGSLNVAIGLYLWLLVEALLNLRAFSDVLIGFLFESFAGMSLVLAVAAFRRSWTYVGWFGAAVIGYCLAGIPFLSLGVALAGWGTVGAIGGYFLFISAAFAYFAGAAIIVNSIWRRGVVPLWGEP